MKNFEVDSLQFLPIPAMILSKTSKLFRYANDAALNKYGYTLDEFCQLTPFDIRPKEDISRANTSINDASTKSQNNQGVWRHKTKEGKTIRVKIFSEPILYDQEECLLVSAVDVSQELTLAQHDRSLLSTIFTNAIVVITNQEGHILDCSDAVLDILGQNYYAIVGQHIDSVIIDTDINWSLLISNSGNNESVNTELRLKGKEATPLVKFNIVPFVSKAFTEEQYLLFGMELIEHNELYTTVNKSLRTIEKLVDQFETQNTNKHLHKKIHTQVKKIDRVMNTTNRGN